jgi:hypothetical protein
MPALTIAFVSFLTLQTPPSSSLPQQTLHSITQSTHGIPGKKKGRERWMVVFKKRSFDLQSFRNAIRTKDQKTVESVVKNLESQAIQDQASFSLFLERDLGGEILEHFWLVNACSIEVSFANLARIRSHPNVAYIHPDKVVEPVTILRATNAGNHAVDALHLKGIRGLGVSIAIMDTGCDLNMNGTGRPHSTFFINGDPTNRKGGGLSGSRLLAAKALGKMGPDDVHNHGTAVAGIASGEKWNSQTNSDRGHAPLSGILSYSVANDKAGSTNLTTITKAWQAIAADVVKYKIIAANNSYSGSPDPTNVSQMALDSAALNTGILPVVAAGNSGSSTGGSQSAANGLSVGATTTDTKKVASFSSRGPLFGDTQRFYPDLCAVGVSLVQPLRDNEGSQWIASGTSMASPQVCGAAALFRSVQPRASNMLTKAALLVSTEDISQRNRNSPFNSRNAYGLGFLRDDRLISLARGAGFLKDSSITTTIPSISFNLAVAKGRRYAVCIAWPRTQLKSKIWSNLSLEAKMGSQSLAFSDTPRNLYEKIEFSAPSSGTVQLIVRGKNLDASTVKFGLAATRIPQPFIPGKVTAFGTGCKGSGIIPNLGNILPRGFSNKFGGTASTVPIGFQALRFQQLFALGQTPKDFITTGLGFRHDDQVFAAMTKEWIELTVYLGYAATTPKTINRSFTVNQYGPQSQVLSRKRINLPTISGRNKKPGDFLLQIPFDRSFLYQTTRKKPLLLDITKHSQSKPRLTFYADAAFDRTTFPASRVYSLSPQSNTGFATVGYGVIIAFLQPGSSGAIPILGSQGEPEIGKSYETTLSLANSNAAVAFFSGNSKAIFQQIPLPLDLSPLGMMGCKLFTNILSVRSFTTDGQGAGGIKTTIPNVTALIGVTLFHQAAIFDPAGNPFGLVLSNALKGTIGGQP